MNKRISILSSIILAISIVIFFVSLVLSLIERKPILDMVSYGACIFLSWSYVVTVIGSCKLCKKDKLIAAEAGKFFGVIYSVFVSLVYFTQLTVIKHKVLPIEIVSVFDYSFTDSWMFSIDIIGYGIMALSTFFVGLTIEPQDKINKVLRYLLLIHGIFIICIYLPMTPIFLGDSDGATTGIIALLFWCMMFLPIALLFAKRFSKVKVM
ncbi:MAG: hypothetical protein FH753_10405 [Firmicutes bacterium]|nr:hypothetical protein [Bacillota bacterium]